MAGEGNAIHKSIRQYINRAPQITLSRGHRILPRRGISEVIPDLASSPNTSFGGAEQLPFRNLWSRGVFPLDMTASFGCAPDTRVLEGVPGALLFLIFLALLERWSPLGVQLVSPQVSTSSKSPWG